MRTYNIVLMVGWLVVAAILHIFSEWLLPGFGFMVLGLWVVMLLVPFRMSSASIAQSTPRSATQSWVLLTVYLFLLPLTVSFIVGMTQVVCRYDLYFQFAIEVWNQTCQIEGFRNISETTLVLYMISWGILAIGLLAQTGPNALQSAMRWERFYGRFDDLACHLGFSVIFMSVIPIIILFRPESVLLLSCVAMFPVSFFSGIHLSFKWYTFLILFVFNFFAAIIIIPALWFGVWWGMNFMSTPRAHQQDLFATYPILELSLFIGAISILPALIMQLLLFKMRA